MKTVVIYNQVSEGLGFFIVDGDQSKFDGIYINEAGADNTLQDELSDLLLLDEEPYYKHDLLLKFPTQEVKDGAIVIICGFLP